MLLEIIKILLPASLVVIGWWIVHWLSCKREKQKELKQNARNKVDRLIEISEETRKSCIDVFSLQVGPNKILELCSLRILIEVLNNNFTILVQCHPSFKEASASFNDFTKSITLTNEYNNPQLAPATIDNQLHMSILVKYNSFIHKLEDQYMATFESSVDDK